MSDWQPASFPVFAFCVGTVVAILVSLLGADPSWSFIAGGTGAVAIGTIYLDWRHDHR